MDQQTSNPTPTRAEEKAGFYDEQFLKGELDDLKLTSLNSLEEEIRALRILNRRLLKLTNDQNDEDADKLINISQTISKVDHIITRMIECQKKLSGGENMREYIVQNLAAMFESFKADDFYLPPLPTPPAASEV